jgi:hypothetical protein
MERIGAEMKRRYAMALFAFAIVIVGCDGSRGVFAPASLIDAPEVKAYASQASSWMDPKASGQDLVYVSSIASGSVYVYTYPQGRLAGTLSGFIQPLGECVDSAGDVFITASANLSFSSGTIYEYAHGGTSPIAVLSDPSLANGCAVEAKSGNLAVSGPDVAIYEHAAGQPKIYSKPGSGFYYCSYDEQGKLYLSAPSNKYGGQSQLVRLDLRSARFESINLNASLYSTSDLWPSVQWDSGHITISSSSKEGDGPLSVYRLRITGNSAEVLGTTSLASKKNRYSGQLWIQGSSVLGAAYDKGRGDVAFWAYPKGGDPSRKIANVSGSLWGVAVSRTRAR